MDSQNARILNWLKSGKTLTAISALKEFHCLRLAARICDLREAGHPIEKVMVKTKKGVYIARYYMKGK